MNHKNLLEKQTLQILKILNQDLKRTFESDSTHAYNGNELWGHLLEDTKLCNALISEMVIALDQIPFSVETQTRSQSLKKIDDLPT